MDREDCTVCFSGHTVLRPDNAGVRDISHLLCTGKVHKNKSVERRRIIKEEEPGFEEALEKDIVGIVHRVIIAFSIVLQKVLLSLREPVARVGSAIEQSLNLFHKKSLSALFWNLFRGKLVFPDKESASFRSILGWIDGRVKLDQAIRPGDENFIPALTIMASKLAYENEATIKDIVKNHWHMEFLECFNCSNDYHGQLVSVQAFMLADKPHDPELIVVAFRGTQPFDMIQWCIDVDFSSYEHPEAGKMHVGFMRALGLQNGGEWPKEIKQCGNGKRFAYYAIREKLRGLLRAHKKAKFVVTGHSLGGAMAILFPTVLMLHKEDWMLERLEGVHTFGQPRVGDKKLGEFIVKRLNEPRQRYFRHVYCNDIVPRLPFDDPAWQYKHFGKCHYYNSIYQGQVMHEEPNKNYFSLPGLLPTHMNAAWELCRSFVIGYMKGSEYREGWMLMSLRLFGLVIPGLPPHCPQDYVNSTRLGVSRVFYSGA